MVWVTEHAMKRLEERRGLTGDDAINNANDAFENGLSTNFIRDPNIWCFIHSKHLDLSNSKKYAKLYQGFIYVFSYKKGRLITVYSLPDYMYKEALKLSKMN